MVRGDRTGDGLQIGELHRSEERFPVLGPWSLIRGRATSPGRSEPATHHES